MSYVNAAIRADAIPPQVDDGEYAQTIALVQNNNRKAAGIMKNFRVLVYIKEPLVSLQLQLELDRMGVDTAIVHDYREAAVLARTLALSFAVIDSHTCDMGDHTLEQALVNRQVSFIALHDGDPYTPAIASRSIRVMSKPFLVEDMVAVIDEFRVDQAENKRCG